MPSVRSIQTAFRFAPDLVTRMKNKSRMTGQSLNSYVESLILKDLDSQEDKYQLLFEELSRYKLPGTISPEISALSMYKVDFTPEEIESDDRLAYILSK